MAGTPKRKRLLITLQKRANEELGEDATPLDYVVSILANGGMLSKLADDIAAQLGESMSRSFLSTVVHGLSEDAKHRILDGRREGASALAEEAASIADSAPESSEGVQKARLRISTRTWMAERFDPFTFGARPEHMIIDIPQLHLNALRARSMTVKASMLPVENPQLRSGDS